MLPRRVTLSTDALFQEIGGEGVILNLSSASYFGLDEVGTRLWQLLKDNPSLHSAIETLLTEYDVGAEQLEQDILQLLKQLSEAGLAEID